jgi:hypothetical protein
MICFTAVMMQLTLELNYLRRVTPGTFARSVSLLSVSIPNRTSGAVAFVP